MAVVKSKPTSPGRRHHVRVVNDDLHKGRPYAPLLEKKSKTGGRNNAGRITTRHIGGGHKQHYRMVDFKRNKDGIPAIVERLEYDPNRTAHIALLLFADGERRYIIAAKGVKAGETLYSGAAAPIKAGNCLPIRNIPAAMVFVPCKDGISHNELEDAKQEHLTAGCNVLFQAVLNQAM
jgi:large subunit ribosomal protein L2